MRVGDANGPVVATFSNRLAAETFAEKQRAKAKDTKLNLRMDAPNGSD